MSTSIVEWLKTSEIGDMILMYPRYVAEGS